MSSLYTRLIDYFSNKDFYQTPEEIRKNRLLINVTVLSIFSSGFQVVNASSIDFKSVVPYLVAGILIAILMLFLFKKNVSYRFCANLYLLDTVFIILMPSYISGGTFSPLIFWFVIVDIIALLLLGLTKNTYIWVGITKLIIILFALGSVMGFQYPRKYDQQFAPFVTFTVLFFSPLLIFAVGSVFERTSRSALKLSADLNAKLEDEKKRSDALLLNILPDTIASRLKLGEQPIADYYEEASIVFIDIVSFTTISAKSNPPKIVETLNDIFTHIDKICLKYNLEKIKTIGDCYMAVSGIPAKMEDHAKRSLLFAMDVLKELNNYYSPTNDKIEFRIGLNCGPVVAGVIGEQKFIYDLWGDAVNTASRMESNGLPNKIQCTDFFKRALEKQNFNVSNFIDRGLIDIKGIGKMQTWLLN
jgi:class 3 adenylate cyclase